MTPRVAAAATAGTPGEETAELTHRRTRNDFYSTTTGVGQCEGIL
jgi:hypothetical protein